MHKEKNTEIVVGVHPIIEVIKAKKRRLLTLYTTKPVPKVWSHIAAIVPKTTEIRYVNREILTKLADTDDHQGFVGVVTPFIFRSKMFDATKQRFLLMLDGIQDVRNLGAILRSAYCTNIDGVILVKKGGTILTPSAFKASAGLAEYLDILIMPSAKAAADQLKKSGYNLYLAVLHDGENAVAVDYKIPACLVIGSEGSGISADIHSSGMRITLPQRRADISYNASVAAGILLFLIGQRINYLPD
jgi:23S rRNA (guanosine2251-2'-O)-methyltransferase